MKNHKSQKHNRQSIRLRGWDYTQPGAYFITICTHQREYLFNDTGIRAVVENAWRNIPSHPHARHVQLDKWVVMPNHLHGILVLVDRYDGDGGKGKAIRIDDSLANDQCSNLLRLYDDHGPTLKPDSIGAIVGNFKSLTARRINNLRHTPGGKIWQRGYYDRIIRSERELDAIREYIQNNPQRWTEDRDNLEGLMAKMDYRL
ncbi:MAG: hypothetical protein FOGNACKC_00491 [Anaerolineae bacterium]|nr:hypothetical protein [Anaerolineae bacterium]